MAMFGGPDPTEYPHGHPLHATHFGSHGPPINPPPPDVQPVDPGPWIEPSLPPEEEKRPPPEPPDVVVILPVIMPPVIVPPVPDMTPPTIVPPEYEDPRPEPLPVDGILPTVQPPPGIAPVAGEQGKGTFMVYVGKRLVLTMAASLGGSLGKSAGAMLVGAVQKQLFRGTTIRFHSGQSYGSYEPPGGRTKASAVSYQEAWRMVPQEFSYWEK